MDRLYVYERRADGKKVEFFSTIRYGKQTYLIREANGQDSVTPDLASLEDFRAALARDGFVQVES